MKASLSAVLFGAAAVLAFRQRRRVAAVLAAFRRPVESGGDAALRVFLLVRRSGRLLLVHPHGRLATAAVFLGLLNILTAVVGTRILHLEWLTGWLPFEVTHGSRALMLLTGIALARLGRALARRKRLAWGLALALAALSSGLYLAHRGSILRAVLAAAFALELWRHRSRFHARTDPVRLRHALVAAPVLALAVSAYGLAGLREFGHPVTHLLAALHATWLIAGFRISPLIAASASAAAWVWSLRLLLVVSVGYVLTAAFAPVAWRLPLAPGALQGRRTGLAVRPRLPFVFRQAGRQAALLRRRARFHRLPREAPGRHRGGRSRGRARRHRRDDRRFCLTTAARTTGFPSSTRRRTVTWANTPGMAWSGSSWQRRPCWTCRTGR